FGTAAGGDVDEGQYRALNAVVRGAVRQKTRQIPPVTVPIGNLALDQMQLSKGHCYVFLEFRVIEAVRDIEKRAGCVVTDYDEDFPYVGRDPFYPHLAVNEHCGNIGGRNQILQIVDDLAGFDDLGL